VEKIEEKKKGQISFGKAWPENVKSPKCGRLRRTREVESEKPVFT